MKLIECLQTLTKSELTEIAKENKFKGYSTLNKDELVEFLCDQILNEDFIHSAVENLPESSRYLLALILSSKNYKKEFYEAKKAFCKQYSSSTFYNAFNTLSSKGLIFEMYGKDDVSYLVIPEEIAEKIANVVVFEDKQRARKREEKQKEKVSFYDILMLASKRSLQELLENAKLAKSGTKDELVKRILEKSGLTPEYILSTVFSKDELIDIAEELGLSAKGNKEEIASRIVFKIGVKRVIPQEKATESLDKYASLFEEVYEVLESFVPYKPADESDVELQVLGYLQGIFGKKGIPVIPQTVKIVRGSLQQPDILVGRSVAIELKYIKRRQDYQKAIGQVTMYASVYPYVILYCYDPENYAQRALIDNIQLPKNVRVIIKR